VKGSRGKSFCAAVALVAAVGLAFSGTQAGAAEPGAKRPPKPACAKQKAKQPARCRTAAKKTKKTAETVNAATRVDAAGALAETDPTETDPTETDPVDPPVDDPVEPDPATDVTPPTIAITAPADGATYTLGQAPPAAYTCSDTESLIVSCVGTVPVDVPFAVAVGTFTFVVAAEDAAGNKAEVSVTYSVRYGFGGFGPPLGGGRSHNAGRALPVKFGLGGHFEGAVTAIRAGACGSGAGDAAESAGGSGLHFEDGQYVFVWKTRKEWAGTCQEISVELADGAVYTASVDFAP
jgi:hypothetical protein